MDVIKDYHRYTELMRNGFYDKLFFVDKLFGEWKSMLDYGAADGFLTKLIAEIFDDKQIVGYETDQVLVQTARLTGSNPGNLRFTQTLKDCHCDVLLLSSVIHEIHSYLSQEEIESFWKFVFGSGFKKIIIRDMLPSGNLHINHAFRKNIADWCGKNGFLGEMKRFEELHGPLTMTYPMIHFMLKYLYITSPNWNRELEENYLSCTLSEVLRRVPGNYYISYKEEYTLPYLAHRWREDFGITTPVHTHAKLIIECDSKL